MQPLARYPVSYVLTRPVFKGLVLVGLLLISFHTTAQDAWKAPSLLDGTMKISAEDLLDFRTEFTGLVIIDARAAHQADDITIENAVAIPSQLISPETLTDATTDKFTPVVFFCEGEHSSDSYKAARKAVALGYATVFWFRGGLQEWLDKGLPVIKRHF